MDLAVDVFSLRLLIDMPDAEWEMMPVEFQRESRSGNLWRSCAGEPAREKRKRCARGGRRRIAGKEEKNWCFNEDISKAIKFSVASSQEGGIDIKARSVTLHVREHSSVRRPVVQMLLFATVLRDTFYIPCSIVRSIVCKAILSKAGWVLPRSWWTNSRNGGAISDTKLEKVDRHANEILVGDAKSAHLRVGEGTPLDSSGWGGKRQDSKMHSDGSSSSTGTPAPLLWLDSGAACHVVGDARILTDLRELFGHYWHC